MKKRYNIILYDGEMQDHVLSHECAHLEVVDTLPKLNRIVAMSLTDEEAEQLRSCPYIQAVEAELDPIEDAQFPRTEQQNLYTRFLPSTTNGADNSSTFFHYMSDMTITGNTGPVGFFSPSPTSEDPSILNQTWTQNYAGNYVDIVAIEAGTPIASNDSHVNHVDFLNDDGNSRFVKMDWNAHGSLNGTGNLQVTNNTEFLSSHAIGVLSACAGLYCGWSKVSSIRVIYLTSGGVGDPTSVVYNAVLDWHQNKPINPATGRRNATVTTGAWGYGGVDHRDAYKIEDVSQIRGYDPIDGTITTINRPVSGWGNDFTPFTDNLISPRVLEDPDDSTDKWYITLPINSFDTTFDAILDSYNDDGSIYHFKSAGNNAGVGVKRNDPRWDTRVTIDANARYIELDVVNNRYVFVPRTTGGGVGYPLRSFTSATSNCFIVGACQHSTANPLGDDYSNRGPYIDLWAFGAYTWTSTPAYSYSDGRWDYFSGTSCAAPVCAGAASIFIDYFFDTRGEYPTFAQLKEYMQNTSKEVIESENYIDWSNTPSAGNFTSGRLYSSTELNRIKEGDLQNGGSDLSDLYGSTTKRAFIPNYILKNTKSRYSSAVKNNFKYNDYVTAKQQYPRRKIRVG